MLSQFSLMMGVAFFSNEGTMFDAYLTKNHGLPYPFISRQKKIICLISTHIGLMARF